jgi:DNA invertase Pin-like site-specific DNA recombinase
MSTPIKAAAYYRMSDDRQEDSIDRQRSQVGPYAAKHGYEVVKEYMDEGISGNETTRRPGFQRLLADAQAGKFQAILCDDLDRFGRFDAIDFGEVVAQGKRDWNKFGDRIVTMLTSETKDSEQQAISRRVLTDMLRRARNGDYLGGPISYGYKAVEDAARGKRLVPDGRKADVVRLIFRLYDEGYTLGAIARELYNRGVASPSGAGRWSRNVILKILGQRKYVGDFCWGVQRVGKRHRLTNGEAAETRRAETRYGKNPPEEWVIVPDTHEPLVDRDLFERVQAKLRGNQKRTTPLPGGGGFLLNKLLVCGDCGAHLLGLTNRGSRQYSCGGYICFGKDFCNRNMVHERPIVNLIIRKLQDLMLNPANLDKIRAEVRALEEARRGEANVTRLQRRIAGLDKKIAQGNDNLTVLPADRVPGLVEVLRRLENERNDLRNELRRAQTESAAEALEGQIAAAEGTLWRLGEAVKDENTPLLRTLLRELVSRVELHWRHEKSKGGQTYSRLDRGVIWLRPQEGLDISNLLPTGTRRSCRSCCGR